MACQLRHWKQMPPMEGTLPWVPWTCCSTPPSGGVEQQVMNNALVPMSGDTYPYRAYLMMKTSAWWLALRLGRAVARATGAQQHKYLVGALACWSVFHLMEFWLQAGNSCTHRGSHSGGTQGQGHSLWTAVPGEGLDSFGGQIPASPCAWSPGTSL